MLDLLEFRENPNMRERPVKGYPRPDWFYLEDNALEDAELEKPNQYVYYFFPKQGFLYKGLK